MATFVLVPGADGRAWGWHRLVPELRARGHEAVTLDLPEDSAADLDAYADAIVAACGDVDRLARPLVLVALSLAGFSAPLACERLRADRLVLLNAMVPLPGETAGEWWDHTGQQAAREAYAREEGRDTAFDMRVDFFHDVPREITEEAMNSAPSGGAPERVFTQPWPLTAWPDVPTRFLQGAQDRFFPLEFQRRLGKERIGVDVEELPGGHLLALSRPRELAQALVRDV
ncbi:alpha/beta fold hydrolase [Streptomyces sp. NPDC088910]|uniref:alpha/beta fold hydrolase n=1 Tax=Streptomyces sp. NPDC088910 TaxID=3365911 RepID=UPI0037FBD50B